jgi:hypothetical protein
MLHSFKRRPSVLKFLSRILNASLQRWLRLRPSDRCHYKKRQAAKRFLEQIRIQPPSSPYYL